MTGIKYSICNNYNIQEGIKFDLSEATAFAQTIANRDNMPAFVDAYVNGYCDEAKSFKVSPWQRHN